MDPHHYSDHGPTIFSNQEQPMTQELKWKKFPVLNDGFICLVGHMGDDASIVQAARVSYGKDERGVAEQNKDLIADKDRNLIRYLLNHGHTTPFEMVEIKFMVRVPMDCWRQWIRHRTASVNEYSTRYTEAINSQQITPPEEWRLQATDNKQGSSGFLEENYWPEDWEWEYQQTTGSVSIKTGEEGFFVFPWVSTNTPSLQNFLTHLEKDHHIQNRDLYEFRIKAGIAKEQARKDLPLSTYTEAYWKCDLHNIFNFLRLRMDSHAQLEIRQYANAMFEIVKGICPVACEAFEDYVLNAKKFSAMEMEVIKYRLETGAENCEKPNSMSDREWEEFLEKLS